MSDKSRRLFAAISELPDEKLDESAVPAFRKRRRWNRWMALAACLALTVGAAAWFLPRLGGRSGGAGSSGSSVFMSYAGPILPLSLRSENDAVTARRDITLDFAPWIPRWISNQEEADSRTGLTEAEREEVLQQYEEWFPNGGYDQSSTDLLVTDTYTLTNHSREPQTLTLLYPYVSQLMGRQQPVLTVDGAEADTQLYAGGRAAAAPEADGSSAGKAECWEDYRELLDSGSYQEAALGHAPDFTGIPAVVYQLTDPWYETSTLAEDINPALQVVTSFDSQKVSLLSYGFHFGSFDWAAGKITMGFSIPEPDSPHYASPRFIIAAGGDVDTFRVEAGRLDDTMPGLEAGARVERRETDLDTALREAAALLYQEWDEMGLTGGTDFELFYRIFSLYLLENGPLSFPPEDRSVGSSLEDGDVCSADRVFYLEAQVTIPAGGSVTVSASFRKEASFDYTCAHTRNQGVYGYDLLTTLGSSLSLTEQTASLEDRGEIRIVRQNFGFNLEEGITSVTLDPEQEHYYLEVRRAG